MSRYDKRYLEKIGNQWRVVISVPRNLQAQLGTKLKRALHTDSLAVANAKKWSVVESLKRDILQAKGDATQDTLVQDAIEMREAAKTWKNDISHGEGVDFVAEDILGDPVSRDPHTLAPIYDPERQRRAALYVTIATGRSTPLTSLVERWHEHEVNRKARTKADDMRALRYLEKWAAANQVSPTLEAIKRKVAGQFVGDLPKLGEGPRLTNRTANKYLSSLSAYWKWLKSRDYVEENVWRGLSLPKEKPKRDEQERPFTDDELNRLLAGEPHMPELGPIMRIAALTGARIDAIVSLRAKDCDGGAFRFKAQKREAGERLVPIHSALASVVEALMRGKAPEDDLFPGIPEPPSGSQRERSMPAVKAFGRYRKTVGVDDTRPGKRRGLVNFHSFRRTFITKAEQAGIPESTIAVVVGHKRQGMTFGTYSGGPTMEQLRACVEAVSLQEL